MAQKGGKPTLAEITLINAGDILTAIDPLRVPPLGSQCKRLEIGSVVLGLARPAVVGPCRNIEGFGERCHAAGNTGAKKTRDRTRNRSRVGGRAYLPTGGPDNDGRRRSVVTANQTE